MILSAICRKVEVRQWNQGPLEMFHLKYRYVYSRCSIPLNTSVVFQVGRVQGHTYYAPSLESVVKSCKPSVPLLFHW